MCRTECYRGPRAPTLHGPAARSPPAAPSVHSVLSEIFGNIVFGCGDEAKRGEEGASKLSSVCPRVRSTTTCDLIMESPASAFLALRNRPSRAVPPYAYARRPPPEVPPVPHHRIALCIRSARSFFFSLFSTLPRSSRPPALDDHDWLRTPAFCWPRGRTAESWPPCSNYFACLRHPLGTHLSPNPVRPTYAAATTDDQRHQMVSHFRSGCTKPGQTPRMSTHCPPSMPSPAPAAAPSM